MLIVDIDGVVAESEFYLRKEIEERSGITLVFSNPRTYNFIENVDIPLNDCNQYIKDAIIKYKDDILPHNYLSTRTALEIIEHKEGRVYFVTSRANGDVNKATHYWLNKYFGGLVYNLYSLGDNISKKDWMKEHYINGIVEDRLRTVNDIGSQFTKTYLVNRGWNIERYTNPYVERVSNLYDAVKRYYKI